MSERGDTTVPDRSFGPCTSGRRRLGRAAASAVLCVAAVLVGCTNTENQRGATVDILARYDRARALRPNPDLWMAANDHVAFVRKKMSDPFGGVLATDWYRPKNAPGERLRVTLNVVGPDLEARNLRIAVFRQVRRGGVWRDGPVSASTVATLHARIMRAARFRAAAK